jgi:hypothetical protein
VDLKNRLRDVETDRRNRLHDLAPSESWGLYQHPHSWHSRAGGGAVHSIISGHQAIIVGTYLRALRGQANMVRR